eukprot:TRINITY_DN17767_c0_g2_i1.p1 TRINITY_DN17767_c0_g2~~TRINITY_DN17767_c0_g2_i1.p1  ORF type:complete len:240 (-),score=12.92 TRINITY_DN17767_c0_g2_i1:175-894(-)
MAENTTSSNATFAGESGGDDAATKLFNTLLVTFIAVYIRFVAVRFRFIRPENGEMQGVGWFIGQVVVPLLVFQCVATARLGDVDLGVVMACSLGKLVVMAFTWGFAFLFYRRDMPVGERVSAATVFSAYVALANDFTIGFPVVQALYGEAMGVYIAANAMVSLLVHFPIIMCLFVIGRVLGKTDQDGDKENTGEDTGYSEYLLCVVLQDLFQNPIIVMTIAALQLFGSGVSVGDWTFLL